MIININCKTGDRVGAEISGHSRTVVRPVLPASFLGTAIRAIDIPMPLARRATNGTRGLFSKPRAGSFGRQRQMQCRIAQFWRQLDPVMLGSFWVTGRTQSQEVAHVVGRIDGKPKSLRDQVMGDKFGSDAAIRATPVALTHFGGSTRPLRAFIFPFAASPRGIIRAIKSVAVVQRHAVAAAIGSRATAFKCVGAELGGALCASIGRHGTNYTAERTVSVHCGAGNTVKPIALMRYLVRLVTPPGGLVLDPFTGSGTTAVAAKLEGAQFMGFELSAEYAAIATARYEAAK